MGNKAIQFERFNPLIDETEDSLDPRCIPEKYRPFLLHPLRRIQVTDNHPERDAISPGAKQGEAANNGQTNTHVLHAERTEETVGPGTPDLRAALELERRRASNLEKRLQEVSEALRAARLNLETNNTAYARLRRDLTTARASKDGVRQELQRLQEEMSRFKERAAREIASLQAQVEQWERRSTMPSRVDNVHRSTAMAQLQEQLAHEREKNGSLLRALKLKENARRTQRDHFQEEINKLKAIIEQQGRTPINEVRGNFDVSENTKLESAPDIHSGGQHGDG